MRKRQYILPCGRVIYYKETTPADIGKGIVMSRRLIAHKKALSALVHPDTTGRKLLPWCGYVYEKFSTILTNHLLERLMNGDRVETLDSHRWMIAGRERKDNNHANWHTDGKSYSIVIDGIKGKFGIRISRVKRQELKKRILNGQAYHS